jgi:DNA-binding MurR/RpiR family transcriptional regulator
MTGTNGSKRRNGAARSRQRASENSAEQLRSISSRIRERFSDLPSQIQVAARFVLDNPQDVALLSMREQSRRAGVPAATMTRLAGLLGFAGFDEMRSIYVGAIRETVDPFSSRAEGLVLRHREVGESGISAQMVDKISSSVANLRLARQKEALLAATRLLSRARKVYCAGQRSAFPIAYHFAYLYGYFSEKPVLLDGPGDIGSDRLNHAGPEDAVLVISMEPCAFRSVEIARFAHAHGIPVVAITNSELSPAGRVADVSILVDLQSPSFFDAMTSAFAACEVLVAMLAGLEGEKVPAAVRKSEQHSRELGAWWSDERHAGRRTQRGEASGKPRKVS